MRTALFVVGAGAVCAVAAAVALPHLRIAPTPGASSGADADLAWLPDLAGEVQPGSAARPVRRVAPYGTGPARFEPNLGQSDPSVTFVRRGPGHMTLLADDGFATVVGRPDPRKTAPGSAGAAVPSAGGGVPMHAMRFDFVGGDPSAETSVEEEQHGRSHHFVGRDASRWVRNVPGYARVVRRGVWPGVDVVFHGRDGFLEYDVVVAPGADPGVAAFRVRGADDVRVDATGALSMRAGDVEVRHLRPVVWEETPDGRRPLAAEFVVGDDSTFRFRVTGRDPARRLVIDPQERLFVEGGFSLRFGGSQSDDVTAVAGGRDGVVVIAGRSFSSDLAFTDDFAGPVTIDSHAFVAKFSNVTSTPDFLAVVGSDMNDVATDIQVAPGGNLFVAGMTLNHLDFPSVNTLPGPGAGGAADAFLFGLNPAGTDLTFARTDGGSLDDLFTSLALLTPAGAATPTTVYAGLLTTSTDGPLPGTAPAGKNAAVMSFGPTGTLGARFFTAGAGDDTKGPVRVAVEDGKIFVAVSTDSIDLPVPSNAFQPVPGGTVRSWVARYRPNGTATPIREASTWFQGSLALYTTAMDTIPGGGIALGGVIPSGTVSTTANALARDPVGGSPQAFYAVFDQDLVSASEVSIVNGDAYVVVTALDVAGASGVTSTVAFAGNSLPGVHIVDDLFNGGSFDAFVAVKPVVGGSVESATYVGGPGDDYANAFLITQSASPISTYVGRQVAILEDGEVVLAGYTTDPNGDWTSVAGGPGGGTDGILMSVTTTAVATAEPPLFPLDALDVTRGSILFRPQTERDQFTATFRWDASGPSPVDLAIGGGGYVGIELVSAISVSQTATIFDADLALDEPGWKLNARKQILTFASPRGQSPIVKALLNLKKQTGTISVSRTDLTEFPLEGNAVFHVELGDQGGEDERLLDVRSASKVVVRPPVTGLAARLDLESRVIQLGQPLFATATLANHTTSTQAVDVSIDHNGFILRTETIVIPPRDPVTLFPGIVQVEASGTPQRRSAKDRVTLVADPLGSFATLRKILGLRVR